MLERCLCNVFAIFDVMLHLLFKHYMYKFVYTLSLVEQTQDRYLYVGKSGINYVNCAYFNVDTIQLIEQLHLLHWHTCAMLNVNTQLLN